MRKGMFTRIWVGILLSAIFLSIWYFGGIVQHVLCSLVALLCTYEVGKALKTKGYRPYIVPLYVFAAVACPVYVIFDVYVLGFVAIACIAATIMFRLLGAERKHEDLFIGLGMYGYPMLLMLFLMFICNLADFALSRIATLLLFAAPLLCDTMAYFFGVFWGHKKLCPHISPKKTVIGSIGGLLGGAMGGVLVYFVQPLLPYVFHVGQTHIELFPLIIIGLVLAVVGQVGDLFASCVKRWANVKDFGSIFPGHGGIMDRLDSVLMCAPLVYLIFIKLPL